MIIIYLLIALVSIWFGLSFGVQVPEYFLPTPTSVAEYILINWPILGRHATLTLLEVCGGLLAALGVALATGYWTYRSQRAQQGLLSFFW